MAGLGLGLGINWRRFTNLESIMGAADLSNLSVLNKWHAAQARMLNGTGRGRLLVLGASGTSAYGVGTGGTNNLTNARANSWPHMLAACVKTFALNPSGIWSDAGLTTGYNAYDPRLVLNSSGSGWSFTFPATLGGYLLAAANASTGNTTFTPVESFDRITVFYVKAGGGTCTINVDGGASLGTIDSSGATALANVTFNVTAGTHAINLVKAGGGPVYIQGIVPWTSTVAAVDLFRAHIAGTPVSGFITNAQPYDALGSIAAIAPDMTIMQFIANDMVSSVPLATWEANLQTLITAAKVSGDFMLVTDAPQNLANWTNGVALGYTDVMEKLAASNEGTFLRLGGTRNPSRYDTYAKGNALFPYYDGLHPGRLMHWDIARAVSQILDIR